MDRRAPARAYGQAQSRSQLQTLPEMPKSPILRCIMIYSNHKPIVVTVAFKMFEGPNCEKRSTVFRKEEQLSYEGEVGHGLKLSKEKAIASSSCSICCEQE